MVEPADQARTEGDSRLDRLVAALVDRFGDRAIEVSRKQRADASGEANATWTAIVERLTDRSPPFGREP